MKRRLSGWALVLATTAWAQGNGTHLGKLVEVFQDNGQLFIHAGAAQGLRVGAVVEVAGGPAIGNTTEHRDVGSATVKEVWGSLARVELDAPATQATGKKFVRLADGMDAPPPDAAPPPPSPGPPNGPTPPAAESALPVRAVLQVQRLTLYNDGEHTLHDCELRLPDNRHYRLTSPLSAKDHEGIMLFRFNQDGVALDRPLDFVQVKCKEGARTVPM